MNPVFQDSVVDSQRALGVSLAAESHYGNPVVFPCPDEILGYILGGFQSVGLEIFRQHTAGDIHSHYDIDPFDVFPAVLAFGLRTSQGHDNQADAD